VADPQLVTDPADPRLADYVSLTDVQLRRTLEPELGLFIAEGELAIRRAIAAGYPVRSLLLVQDKAAELAAELGPAIGAPVYVVPASLAQVLTGFRVHRGALASMQRRPLLTVAEVLAGAHRIVVLEDMVDHTNVGAIFRSVAALGFDAVVLAPRCADPLYRRSVRVSIGSVFAVPYARLTDWAGGLQELKAHGFRLVALTPDEQAIPIGELEATTRLALLVGTEGAGLSARWAAAADVAARIPMRNGIDSLNVGSAVAIACYLLAGDREPAAGGRQAAVMPGRACDG
jgi:tRNA G18 (ribose-2'-O)-methylase SpoU